MNKECLCVGVLLFNGGEIVYLSVDVVMIKYNDILINYLLDFKWVENDNFDLVRRFVVLFVWRG